MHPPASELRSVPRAPVPAAQGRLGRFAWGVLIYNVAVILWGALVRATGSGAGCGGHWPLCNGQALPSIAQAATIIELTHRVMSGIALVLVVTLFVKTRQSCPPPHPARRWASWSLIFILTEALLGAALVLLGHVAKDASTGRVYSLSAHLVNTFLLLASLTLTARWSPAMATPVESFKIGWRSIAPLAAVALVAVAGAITALGDTLFPAHTLAEGLRDDFISTANFLVRLRVIHPALAAGAAGWLAWDGPRCPPRRRPAPPWAGRGASRAGGRAGPGGSGQYSPQSALTHATAPLASRRLSMDHPGSVRVRAYACLERILMQPTATPPLRGGPDRLDFTELVR